MKTEIETLQDEIEKWKNAYHAAMRIVKSTYPDKFPDNYFICGELGEKDVNNMPQKIMVCPAYGVDFSYVYEYTGVTTGPEW